MQYIPINHLLKNGNDGSNSPPPGRQQNMLNTQSDLQMIFIALLSQYSTITIGRPHNKAVKTRQFVRLKSINFRGDEIDITDYLKMRCHDKTEYIKKLGVTDKTAVRRFNFTKRQEILHLIQDILFQFGYYTEIENDEADGIEGEIAIYFKSKFIVGSQEVTEKGIKINSFICSKLNTTNEVVLDSSLYHSFFD